MIVAWSRIMAIYYDLKQKFDLTKALKKFITERFEQNDLPNVP